MKLVCLDSITTEEYLQLEREMHRSIRNRRLTASHYNKKNKVLLYQRTAHYSTNCTNF